MVACIFKILSTCYIIGVCKLSWTFASYSYLFPVTVVPKLPCHLPWTKSSFARESFMRRGCISLPIKGNWLLRLNCIYMVFVQMGLLGTYYNRICMGCRCMDRWGLFSKGTNKKIFKLVSIFKYVFLISNSFKIFNIKKNVFKDDISKFLT